MSRVKLVRPLAGLGHRDTSHQREAGAGLETERY